MTGPHDTRPDQYPAFVPYEPYPAGPSQPAGRSRGAQIALVVLITTVAFVVIAAVAAVAMIAVGAATKADRTAAPTITPATLHVPTITTPVVPTVNQVRSNAILSKTLSTPACTLPAWSTTLGGMQAFTDAANDCFGRVWGTRMPRITVFESSGNLAPASTGCPTDQPTLGFWVCSGGSATNYTSMVSSIGSQLGSGIEWLARIAAIRVSFDGGQRADVKALVTQVGGSGTPLGTEYLRRQAAQRACLTGGTLGMMVDHGISRADLDGAAAAAALWTDLDEATGHALAGPALSTWFTRGAAVRTTAPCADAWSAPVDQLP
ncbi:hypothetical protein HWD35_15205 [Tsukamurella tyrosinosolvens]|mgnify:CR=1 FL=1|uniref:hypothetical protein n=1 Tax=Tsukamurella tyrosinosolvens TaxID=57704 RepID=UPI0007921CCB|nr:hypothetical protein [Tsukamurella tyrosinosolvens]KXP08518.1 hypothetical protein AXK59_23460 [Tsukamurella tyrosinosolvens]KZL96219.1 hypothetical protein AXX05_11690 [Tsukamurella tyrosinosolvens]MCA4996064.1 hypothetical protein [Tsukamurella tyrosinosolvens]